MKLAMPFLHAIVLLVLAGGIQCSPVKRNFSFLINQDLEVRRVYTAIESAAVFNCTTNDLTANVTLNRTDSQLRQQKITRNGAVFTIHHITRHDAGHYLCVAKRKNGQVITRKILLYIDSRTPSVTVDPHKNRRVLHGSPLKYVCEGNMGTLTWFKDGVELPTDSLPGVSVFSSHGPNGILEKDLVISQADFAHSGRYRCLLTLKGFTSFQYVEVSVKAPEPASITSVTPHSIFVNDTDSGPDVELDCRVSGFPPPKITWTKDGKEIKKCYKSHPCEKIQRYILTSHNGLIIRKKNISLDDQGVYHCEAENAFGRAFKEIVVDLPSPPVLEKLKGREKIVKWYAGQKKSIVFSCHATRGAPRLRFKWFIAFGSTKMFVSSKNKFYKGCFTQRDGAKSSILETPGKLASSCFAWRLQVKCSVENDYGKDEVVYTLLEISSPSNARD